VKRGKNPSRGEWSIPGGAVNVGESLKVAAAREIKEETGLDIFVEEPVELLERISSDLDNRVRYHYVLIDYCGKCLGGKLKASSDIVEARFVSPEKLDAFSLNPATRNVIEKALGCSINKKPIKPYAPEIFTDWNQKKAKWYFRALRESDFSEMVMAAVMPLVRNSDSVLDIGAGCGALTIPLAERVKKVTALEPSKPMMNIMRREALKKGLKNINFVNALWGKTKLSVHSILFLANVPKVLKDMKLFLEDLDKIKPRLVFLIHGVDSKKDKFYFKELYPLIFRKIFPEKNDYLQIYDSLHHLGVYANIKIISYNMDQPFKSLDEAVDFWKEYLNIKGRDYDKKLKSFLKKKLFKTPYGFKTVVNKQGAVIWWEKSY